MNINYIKETHNCTNCKVVLRYTVKGSWYNARKKLRDTGELFCTVCAGKIGRKRSNKKPTGRPKGSKNGKNIVAWNKGLSDNINNIGWHKKEVRQLQIARRNGYNSYKEYKAAQPAWERYKVDVRRATEKQPLHKLKHIEKRGVNGQKGAYTLDHIISIKEGFDNNIPPEEVGDISNLQMLPWKENIQKGW